MKKRSLTRLVRHKCGRTLCFHGFFVSKKKAVAKERKVRGFILKRGGRYLVATNKPTRKKRRRK